MKCKEKWRIVNVATHQHNHKLKRSHFLVVLCFAQSAQLMQKFYPGGNNILCTIFRRKAWICKFYLFSTFQKNQSKKEIEGSLKIIFCCVPFYDATHLVIVLQFSWKLTLTQIDVSRNVGAAKKSRDAQLAWSSCLRSSSSEGAKCKLSFLLTLKVWSKFNKVLIINMANLNLVWTTSQCSKSQKKSHSTLRAKRAAFIFWVVDKS